MPNNTEWLDEILEELAENYYPEHEYGDNWRVRNSNLRQSAKELILQKISELETAARIDELNAWFDMPKHYPGEEYRDEHYVKVKCKTPMKISYVTLDSSFTYSVLNRIAELRQKLGIGE